MKYEWKKGDKLRMITQPNTTIVHVGDIVTAMNDISTDSVNMDVTVSITNDGSNINTWDTRRFEKLSSDYKPEEPKFAVVWDTKTIDPIRFFAKKEEALKFIKELIEKPDTKKDSIKLVEIKSIEKVSYNLKLSYSKFLI